MRQTVHRCGIALMAACCVPPSVRAQDPPHGLSPGKEAAITGAGLAFHGTAFLLARQPVPEVRWPLDPSGLPGVDRGTVGRWSGPSHRASNVLFGVAAGASLLTAVLVREDRKPLVPVVVLFESGLLAAGITDVVKEAAHRPRPYLYDPAVPAEAFKGRDDHHSFWSGRTANTAALTFAAAHLVQRSDASRGVKRAVWAGAAALPAAVGWLRVDSGRHFPTDVLTGYAFGALLGWAVPYLHRPRKSASAH